MAENLRVTHYFDGTEIPRVEDDEQWANLIDNDLDDAYYLIDIMGEIQLGALYTWAAAMGGSTNYVGLVSQGVCPTGWHLPNNTEFGMLSDFLGGEYIAGGKLKATGSEFWNLPNNGATNESQFSALPSGYRLYDTGIYEGFGHFVSFWSATELNPEYAFDWYILSNETRFYPGYDAKSYGFSVRCIKD